MSSFVLSGSEEVNVAVGAAKDAFEEGGWSRAPASERSNKLLRWAELIEKDLERLAIIEADEAGKVMSAAREELQWSLELLRFAASLALNLPGRSNTYEGNERVGLVSYEPFPVVGMIVPWNFPTVTLFQKLPYALAAGCSVVVKPSELTSGTALEYATLAKSAGIPDGVVNVVTGTGVAVGEPLCDHPDVEMISFTGSTVVGKKIAQRAGGNLKKVSLELGGKGANIVFADANIEDALEGALAAFTINQGEECCAGGRLLVEKSIAGEFLTKLEARAKNLKVGPPSDLEADIGPMIHEQHMQKVLNYIETAQKSGARLVAGGIRVREGGLENGFFVAPTVLADVTPDMQIFREEVFGPVVGVTTFETEAEAIEMANDTEYGLANGVWTKDLDKAFRVSRSLRSGTVYVNTYLETIPQLPFGGMKQSGLGRENGIEGLCEFMESKSTFIRIGAE